MTDSNNSTASNRLTQIKDVLTMNKTTTTIPWDPDCTVFPTRKELPRIEGAPKDAAWVWGADDFVGRLNLLTPSRVAAASQEIRTGETIPVNLPLNVPETPSFGREKFQHTIKELAKDVAYDDLYTMNTQSGTQWDGFRHMAHMASQTFYNNTKGHDIVGETANQKCSIHHWAERGIAGRGVLLDYRRYAHLKGLEYDPYSRHAITFAELQQCGRNQGIDIRPQAQGGDIKPGDVLFVRSGFTESYMSKKPAERTELATRRHQFGPEDGQRYAGVAQEEPILDWLHDCYFAAVAGDAPSFEAWPSNQSYYLHEYILALWGMPLGELLDLEKLAIRCHERSHWFFFFTSAPANCPSGVSSHVNGLAIL